MAPLKSLEREFPILDSSFQQFCASRSIFTVEDFLLQDINTLIACAEQRFNSERLKQGITQILSIIDKRHKPWSNGLELLQDAQLHKQVLSTGCQGIDLLQKGGLRKGQITELVGQTSSGKTQVCLQVAANVAKKYAGRIVYLDTGHSFSPQRIRHFVSQNVDTGSKQVKERILQQVMTNILCHSVFDIFAMLDVLNELECSLRSQMQLRESQVHLLIIDSISSVVTPVLGGSGSHGHALMVSAGFLLKKLAHEHNLAVLVINHMVGGEGGIPKPALGESWKTIPHVRLLLSRQHGSNIGSMTILKHTVMASGKVVRFPISD